MDISSIEGLSALESGQILDPLRGSKFAMPPGFPTKFASKWAEEGPQVIEAQQKQILQSANCAADGWQVYMVVDEEKTEILREKKFLEAKQAQEESYAALLAQEDDPQKKLKIRRPDLKVDKIAPIKVPFKRAAGKKIFVLMFRPRQLQGAVNKIYADVSRNLVRQEVKGESVSANPQLDEGVLSSQDIKRFGKTFDDAEGTGEYLPANAGGKPTRLHEASDVEIQ